MDNNIAVLSELIEHCSEANRLLVANAISMENGDIKEAQSYTREVSSLLAVILKDALINLENGKIDVSIYDKYLENGKDGLLLNVPIFLGSNNIFLNNLGPKIPIIINFNGSLLTNIKTKVTNYGLNNALLEIYITVEIEKLIITPVVKDKEKFYYDILIGAVVVNGTVPNFYGGTYENSSNILDIPLS